MKHLFFLLILSFSLSSFAEKEKVDDDLKPLKDTLAKIQKAACVEFRLEKTIHSDVMGTDKVYKGHAYLAGALFRFETEAPEKTLVVYDGKILWVVQYPDPAFGGKIQVSRSRVKGKQKDQLILSQLLSEGKLLDSFDVKKTAEEKKLFSYEGKPKDKSMNVQKVALQVKDKALRELDYVDDVGNKTALKMTSQKLLKNLDSKHFEYHPEKGAQVSDL